MKGLKRENKVELKRILTAELQKTEPILSQVLISDNGEFAVLQVAGESFLEPE